MTIKVGSARIDERGKISGGAAGDQTGKEVAEQNFYWHSKGWYAFIPKNPAHGTALAKAMISACNNNNIGYDQRNRLDVINKLKQYGSLSAIKVPTEADCSSLVRACIIQACNKDIGNQNTASLPEALLNSKLFTKVNLTSESQLTLGAVLVTKKKGHTVIVTHCTTTDKVPVSKNTVKASVDAAMYFDKSLAGTYKVTASSLYLRTGASKNKTILKSMPRGTSVSCYGYYNKDGFQKWLYVTVGGVIGYCSLKYLRK